MRNSNLWHPTKFVETRKGLRGSREDRYLYRGSRFVADIQAMVYERAIQAHAFGRLLDLGCGDVPLYGIYKKLVSESICIDWDKTLHVNQFLDESADLSRELPFPDSSFDVVLMTDVLPHVPEPAFTMQQVARVLRPGGKIILGCPFFYWINEKPFDYYRYTQFALQRFCEISGLTIIELSPYGGLIEVLLDLTSKALCSLPTWLERMLRPIHSLGAVLSSIRLGQSERHKGADSYPLGFMLVAMKPR